MGRQYRSIEHLNQIVNNNTTQECGHQDGGRDGHGLQEGERYGGGGREGRDDGQADGQVGDSAQMYGGGGGEVHAGGHSYLRAQAPQDGAVQGHGERVDQVEVGSHQADGGGGGDERDERESGQADGQDEDSARKYGGKGGEIHAGRHSYLRDQAPQGGAVQDQGEQVEHVGVEVVGGGGGEECDERVGVVRVLVSLAEDL